MPKCCVPTSTIDPLLVPTVLDPLMSPAQKLEWCIAQILDLQRRVDELEGRTADNEGTA